ncbi:MAG TPA: hypothetical protein VN642_14640 [Dongiaceae bacterium]|nr:hypothetical protein [Dongiaceae bacterium]
MKIIVMAVFCVVALCGCVDHIHTTDLTSAMTKQEVIQRLGKPVRASMQGEEQQLIFLIHDHAFGRDKNYYAIGFKDDHLTSIVPLPEDQQEERGDLIDQSLRRHRY